MVKKYLRRLGELLGNKEFFIRKNIMPICFIFVIGIIVTLLFANLLIANLFTAGKVMGFLKSQLSSGVELTVNSYGEQEGYVYYNITLSNGEQTQNMLLYSDIWGTKIFTNAISTTAVPRQTTEEVAFDAPDKETPLVELYVMAFCPYGVQAENTLLPVFNVLKDTANINVYYILTDNEGTITSLHGQAEVDEDARQLCVLDTFGKEKYWNYLEKFNTKCIDLSSEEAYAKTLENAETCSKSVIKELGFDSNAFNVCVKDERLGLLKTHAIITKAKNIVSSPTLLINDASYSGSRTSEDFKNGICSGFTTKPDVCATELSKAQTAASGKCI